MLHDSIMHKHSKQFRSTKYNDFPRQAGHHLTPTFCYANIIHCFIRGIKQFFWEGSVMSGQQILHKKVHTALAISRIRVMFRFCQICLQTVCAVQQLAEWSNITITTRINHAVCTFFYACFSVWFVSKGKAVLRYEIIHRAMPWSTKYDL